MNDMLILKKEIARLNIQLGQAQLYVAELEEMLLNTEKKENEMQTDTRKYDDISQQKLHQTSP